MSGSARGGAVFSSKAHGAVKTVLVGDADSAAYMRRTPDIPSMQAWWILV